MSAPKHYADLEGYWEPGLVHVYDTSAAPGVELFTLDPVGAYNLARSLLIAARAGAEASVNEWPIPKGVGWDVENTGAIRL